MTIVVTRDVAARYRGFLASCMLEIAPGVYTSPRMTRAVRDRVWRVLEQWWARIPGGSIVMTWPDLALPGGQEILVLGLPPVHLVEYNGIYLSCRPSSGGGDSLKDQDVIDIEGDGSGSQGSG